MSIILGLDPGTSSVGFGILKKTGGKMEILDWGIISTPPNLSLPQKLLQIGDDLHELIDTYSPEIAGMEELFFTNNIKTGIAVSHSRWVLAYILAKKWIPCLEWTPSQVKKGICQNGRANKAQIQKTVQILFWLAEPPQPDDAADALAIAYLTGLQHHPKKIV